MREVDEDVGRIGNFFGFWPSQQPLRMWRGWGMRMAKLAELRERIGRQFFARKLNELTIDVIHLGCSFSIDGVVDRESSGLTLLISRALSLCLAVERLCGAERPALESDIALTD
ncbi:hypothetical protein PRIPAC_76101 [Pristionchus pacificus]|uniref:Uncharacterized protein n=1 Tax=Pristionchus pacificus TaxID=54126 RepID=A0A2A6C793_PRIPA|nr:hypothetical protein PRIPAC_76101 [Pristionchus pacificus]|eukprot:PDM74054.1 hypothetical protein PRIPAC_41410 [Pristionchus pacificus]